MRWYFIISDLLISSFLRQDLTVLNNLPAYYYLMRQFRKKFIRSYKLRIRESTGDRRSILPFDVYKKERWESGASFQFVRTKSPFIIHCLLSSCHWKKNKGFVQILKYITFFLPELRQIWRSLYHTSKPLPQTLLVFHCFAHTYLGSTRNGES